MEHLSKNCGKGEISCLDCEVQFTRSEIYDHDCYPVIVGKIKDLEQENLKLSERLSVQETLSVT